MLKPHVAFCLKNAQRSVCGGSGTFRMISFKYVYMHTHSVSQFDSLDIEDTCSVRLPLFVPHVFSIQVWKKTFILPLNTKSDFFLKNTLGTPFKIFKVNDNWVHQAPILQKSNIDGSIRLMHHIYFFTSIELLTAETCSFSKLNLRIK